MNKKNPINQSILNYFRPSLFVKDYTNLDVYSFKKIGIKMLICDLDNTLSPHFNRFPNKHAMKFVTDVKNQGILFIVVSNNTRKRVSKYCKLLKPDDFIWNAKKPLLRKIKKVMNKYDVLSDEMIILGDQFVTDVWAANRIGCRSILVLPMIDPNKDDKSSKFIRILDKFIYQKLQLNNLLLDQKNMELESKYELL